MRDNPSKKPVLTLLALMLCAASQLSHADEAAKSAPPSPIKLNLPDGFKVSIFANLNTAGKRQASPRMLAFNRQGQLFVSSTSANAVYMLPDSNQDGQADAMITVAKHLNAPNGLAFVGDDLLIANQDGVVKLTQTQGKWSAPTPLVSDLPTGGHTLKSVKLGPDGFLYINVGSSCNVCVEDDPQRATILRYTLQGKPAGALKNSESAIWAQGLRNSQGFAWHPQTGAMFATNEGADNRSDIQNGKVNDELPPEHLNKIEAGKHYGWPYCWGDAASKRMVQDPNFVGEAHFCKSATAPAITLPAHATPIGITFLDQSQFPAEYKTDAIIALHGSWNRKNPSGYKLVRVKFNGARPVEVVDFATGWLNQASAWGRPTDVAVGNDGALYVSDDRAGYIYRIWYAPPH